MMKIAVLAGGYSPEREVSLVSGAKIAGALAGCGHRVALIDLYLGVPLAPGEDPEDLFTQKAPEVPTVKESAPDLEALRAESGNGDGLIGKNVLRVLRAADRVFLALHGGIGEDGRLQAVLDCEGIPYTGSSSLGCAVSMDKNISKHLLRGAGIPTPDWVYFPAETDPAAAEAEVLARVGVPCAVKPIGCGSSVGVTLVRDRSRLPEAIREAAKWGAFLAETLIEGRELTVGVLREHALPVVEIVPPEDGFYDYRNKYNGATRELCPAPIPEEIAEKVGRLSLAGMQALSLSSYARFDWMLSADGELYCLEANALPGMTPSSLLPTAAAADGISYDRLCEMIVNAE